MPDQIIYTVVTYTEGGIVCEAYYDPAKAHDRCEAIFAEIGENPGFYSVEVCETALLT